MAQKQFYRFIVYWMRFTALLKQANSMPKPDHLTMALVAVRYYYKQNKKRKWRKNLNKSRGKPMFFQFTVEIINWSIRHVLQFHFFATISIIYRNSLLSVGTSFNRKSIFSMELTCNAVKNGKYISGSSNFPTGPVASGTNCLPKRAAMK